MQVLVMAQRIRPGESGAVGQSTNGPSPES
ncbi:hypothetical protein BH09ACT12_BH09ACT12_10860 [soil metagenome]